MLKQTRNILLARTCTKPKKKTTLTRQKGPHSTHFSHQILSTFSDRDNIRSRNLEKLLVYVQIQFCNSGFWLNMQVVATCIHTDIVRSRTHTLLWLVEEEGVDCVLVDSASGFFSSVAMVLELANETYGAWGGEWMCCFKRQLLPRRGEAALKQKPGRKTKYSH